MIICMTQIGKNGWGLVCILLEASMFRYTNNYLVASLIWKKCNVVKGDTDMKQAYEQLTASLDPKWIMEWT